MSKEVLLHCKHMFKSFGPTKALVDVELEVNRGEIRGLIGENGSGKSTISSIVAGVQPYDSGEMFFKGEPYKPTSMIEAQAKGIAMVVQEMGTISNITVAANIFIGKEKLFCKGPFLSVKKMNEAAKKILVEIGADHIDPAAPINDLNFEDRKIVEIARAMYDHPEIFIVDETTTALSQRGRDIVYNIMRKLSSEKKAVLFISHDLSVVEYISDTVGVMYLGNMVEFAPTDKLYANPKHPYTEALFSAIPVPDPDYKMNRIILEGSIPSPANPPKGCKFHTRCRKCMEICKYVQPDFVELEPEHFCACHLYNSPERSKELEAVMQDAIREIEASKNGEKSKKGK